ncbi:MAG: hypothetical protein NTY37_13010 [Methanothrix sp.]|nr:hypothetical protein [Methanothrix sp.]
MHLLLGSRLRHAHHLLCHPIGLALVLVAGLIYDELRLEGSGEEPLLHRLVADGLLMGKERTQGRLGPCPM